ncbi:LptF/LptG family permease [Marinobacter sp.]|uniref:LptF/LptG family permease n=1 Tax=Marinobacter sp. TaxID=50741 RepID=UPI003A95040C
MFIGILLAYGRMYLESEMTVLFACGVSERQLLVKTLLGAFRRDRGWCNEFYVSLGDEAGRADFQ